MKIIKIPQERVKELRGKANQTIAMLSEKLNIGIVVDNDGTVTIEGEPVDEFFSEDVIRAIGRGFEAGTALKLMVEDYCLKVIDIRDYTRKRAAMARIKGRVIGLKGKSKKIIEQQSECHLAIHGHTVAIIGPLDTIGLATNAVFKLIEGVPHSGVYLYLQRARRKIDEERLLGKMRK